MSNMKNGFSTLNRWLGKKNKEKSTAPNGKLSKSSTNLSLSISTTNINETSQLEYNRIAPLPAVTSNAPFEQTFRITVLLPKDQLYVARLGARVPLSKLLELVCDHKSLDAQKYEFRNPVDPSQIYSCDLTIGAVGLSEIRLCHKSDSYESYNTDEVMKLHRTSVIRDSLSSSEFSSRNSKHTTKTASPYSSSNSLNSMDSTGMNYTRTPVSPPPSLAKTTPPNIVVPPRKKRAAPRPPSQVVIPEKAALVIEQEAQQTEQTIEQLKQQQDAMSMPTRKDYYASTPNLNGDVTDCNGNTSPSAASIANGNNVVAENNHTEEVIYAQVAQKNARNLYGGSVQNLSSTSPVEQSKQLPEPSPRKRLIQLKKKSAPAPPPRGSSMVNGDDTISIASTTLSTPDTPHTADSEKSLSFHEQHFTTAPTPVLRESTAATQQVIQCSTPIDETKPAEAGPASPSLPKPVPRQTTTTLLNATPTEHTKSPSPSSPTQQSNVSKVLLNRTPTPEPRSFSCEPSDSEGQPSSLPVHTHCDDDDNVSKQADSGIGEPVPSPIPDSLPSEGSAHECKSTFESSSDDDDMVKTYNCKLGKTIVKTTNNLPAATTIEELRVLQLNSGEVTPDTLTHEPTPNTAETSSWNFAIPISPPPNFADSALQPIESSFTDVPITPKIVERPVLVFEQLQPVESSTDVTDDSAQKIDTPVDKCPRTPLPSPSSPINEIIDELSTILNENRMDSLIKKHDEHTEIESAKPSTLSNFSITTLSTQQSIKSLDARIPNEPTTPESVPEEEKLYKKRITNGGSALKQRKSITRADSFHTTSSANSVLSQNSTKADSTNGLNSRSSSYLSLTKLDQSNGLNRRRSSSELSIGESPSLQSLEVIKTILNSRKNSLANSSDGESKSPSVDIINVERKPTVETTKIESVELKPKPTETVAPAKAEESEKPKELPKVYRYSGPPSINFSTWSERPKVQVAIKNEGDYIFGGKNAGTQNAAVTRAAVEIRSMQTVPRNQRYTMPPEVSKPTSPPAVAPKPTISSTTERMGIPEKEYHVPVTVRPLKDVTVESVGLHKDISTTPNVTKIMLNGDQETTSKKPEITKTTITTNQRQFTHASDTSTLPRAGNAASRFSMPNNSTTNLLRSTSITKLEQKNSTRTEHEQIAPFGQNTLRKTGLKEKILAKEEQAQKQQTVVTLNSTMNSTQNGIANGVPPKPITTSYTNGTLNITNRGPFGKPTKTLQSAKLELKLQQSANVFTTQENGSSSVSPQPAKVTTPKSAPAVPTPPAPPMPVLKSVTLRSQSTGAATTPTNGDPRDALLEAIRSFRRDDLNKV